MHTDMPNRIDFNVASKGMGFCILYMMISLRKPVAFTVIYQSATQI